MTMIIVLLGLILGSFLNMLVYRLPRGESLWGPRSQCPTCGATLKFFDLLPVLSYLFLKGRCRYCSERISWSYLVLEVFTALILLVMYLSWSWSWLFFRGACLFLLLLPLALIDWEHQILPNQLTLGGLVLGLLLALVGDHLTIWNSLLGVLIGGGFLLLVALVFPQGMGGGDIKLMAMVGSFLGWTQVLVAIFLGAILGLIYFALAYLAKKITRETPLPFGTFLALSTIVVMFWGSTLLELYLRILGF